MKRKWLEGLSPAHVEALDRARREILHSPTSENERARAVSRTLVVEGQEWDTPRGWRLSVRKRARRLLRKKGRARSIGGIDFDGGSNTMIVFTIIRAGVQTIEEAIASNLRPTLSITAMRKKK